MKQLSGGVAGPVLGYAAFVPRGFQDPTRQSPEQPALTPELALL